MIAEHLRSRLLEAGLLAFGPGAWPPVEAFRERDAARADFATNWPMRLARPLGQAPDAIARALAAALPADPAIALAVPAAGYVNLRLADAWLAGRLADKLEAGAGRLKVPSFTNPFKEASERADEQERAESLADPRFYLDYTRARLAGLVRLAEAEGLPGWKRGDALDLTDPLARDLLLRLLDDEPTARLMTELCQAFHRFYSARRMFGQPAPITAGRLALVQGTLLALDPVMLNVPDVGDHVGP